MVVVVRGGVFDICKSVLKLHIYHFHPATLGLPVTVGPSACTQGRADLCRASGRKKTIPPPPLIQL